MRLLALLLLFGLCACGQKTENKNYSINPKAKQLNDSAISVVMYSQDYNKAIALLDQAIKIDSNYLTASANKLSFELQLKQFDNALATAKNLIRIRPEAPNYFVIIGIIYEKTGDTVSSKKYFTEASMHYDKILDTMSTTNKQYNSLLMNKALSLVLLGQQQKGNNILKQLYDKEKNEAYKDILDLFINKSRQEIMDNFSLKE